MKDDNIIGWFSLENGQHVPLREGESKKEATSKFLNKKMSRVAKNKDKYGKIEEFKRKKQSNNKIDKKEPEKEEFNKKVTKLVKQDNKYIPVREGESEEEAVNKYTKTEEDRVYKQIADTYGSEYNKRQKVREAQETGNYDKLTQDDRMSNFNIPEEAQKDLDTMYEKAKSESRQLTKEEVKSTIDAYRNRKMSTINNERRATTNNSEIAKLESEKEYLENEMRKQKIGRQIGTLDTPINPFSIMRDTNLMTAEEKKTYNNLKARYEEVSEKIENNWENGTYKPISKGTNVAEDIIRPFGTKENFVKQMDKMARENNGDIYKTAERYVREGNYATSNKEIREYYKEKFEPEDKQRKAKTKEYTENYDKKWSKNLGLEYKKAPEDEESEYWVANDTNNAVVRTFYIQNMAKKMQQLYNKYK